MKKHALIMLLIAVSGCLGVSTEEVESGDVRGLQECLGAAIEIETAEWENNELSIVVSNTGSRDLSGFHVVSRSEHGTISTTKSTSLPVGQNTTMRLGTIDEPRTAEVTSEECSGASARSDVVTE